MRLVEIKALPNGAHNNLKTFGELSASVPEGWAIIPDDMMCRNFPFGDLTVDGSNPPVVTSWTPKAMPNPEPEPEPKAEEESSFWDELDAAYREGVDSV